MAPHHPNKPFLLLQPEELSSTVALDPRFAYARAALRVMSKSYVYVHGQADILIVSKLCAR